VFILIITLACILTFIWTGFSGVPLAHNGGMTVAPGHGFSTIYCESTGGLWNWSASGECSSPYEFDLTLNDSDY